MSSLIPIDDGGSEPVNPLSEADLLQLEGDFNAAHPPPPTAPAAVVAKLSMKPLIPIGADADAPRPSAGIAPGSSDSTQSLLDLELASAGDSTNPNLAPDSALMPALAPLLPKPGNDRSSSPDRNNNSNSLHLPGGTASPNSQPGTPGRQLANLGKSMTDAFKKGLRSRSPSNVSATVVDAAIPFSMTTNTNATAATDQAVDFFASALSAASAAASSSRRVSTATPPLPGHQQQQPQQHQQPHHQFFNHPGSTSGSRESLSPSRPTLEQRLAMRTASGGSSPGTSAQISSPTESAASPGSGIHDFTPAPLLNKTAGPMRASFEHLGSQTLSTPHPPAPPTSQPSFANFSDFPASVSAPRNAPLLQPQVPIQLDPAHATLPTRKWTEPSMFHDIPDADPVAEAIRRLWPSDGVVSSPQRPNRTLMSVEAAEQKYGKGGAAKGLIMNHSWRALANLARVRLLALAGSPHRISLISRWWLCRLVALERLRLHDLLFLELDALLPDPNDPNLTYEAHPTAFPLPADGDTSTKARKGCFVPFDLKLFWARSPILRASPHEAITRLYGLLSETRRAGRESSHRDRSASTASDVPGEEEEDPPSSLDARETQLQLAVSGVLLEMKDFRLAVGILEGVAGIAGTAKGTGGPLGRHHRVAVLTALGRAQLQLGAVGRARVAFEEVEMLLAPEGVVRSPGVREDAEEAWLMGSLKPGLVLTNRAFLAIAEEGDWEKAAKCLNQVVSRDPSDPVAINNLAVCHLYMGDLSRAISFLESVVTEMPLFAGSCSPILFNLSTLFDLADHSADRKKRLLANVISKHAGDDLDPACLKI